MKDTIIIQLVKLALPMLTATLTVALGKLVLNARGGLDKLPAPVKQGVIVVISGVLAALTSVLGADFCGQLGVADACSLDNLNKEVLSSALLAFAIHNGLKKRKP
jgi:hypothetical protein